MTRRLLASLLLLGAGVGAARVRLPWAILASTLIGVCSVAYWLWRCPHDGPLALLPATTDIEGQPLPARWSCDACGKTWAANFEREKTPIYSFSGHDETKAPVAAERARKLAEEQKALAIQRAGLVRATKGAKPVRPVADIAERRKAAGR